MRLIYTDEAATTAGEPVSVVAAFIVNPDVHWFPVMRRLRGIWDQHIPSEYRRQNRHHLTTLTISNAFHPLPSDLCR
jgi:hypothetical protein